MPDLDLVTANGPLRTFTLLHDARPVLLNFSEPGHLDITQWADRVQLVDAKYPGVWELPVIGTVTVPAAVLIRPDGYVAWVGDKTDQGLADALEHFSIRLGVSRVCEISFAFFFGNPFEKRGDGSPKLLNSARLHFA